MECVFDGKYPIPYRNTEIEEISENSKVEKIKMLVNYIAAAEKEYISINCKYLGIQLAILEIFTTRFDENTALKTPFHITYYLESDLLVDENDREKINVSTKKGIVYKEEMTLLILQIKYLILQRSGKYNSKNSVMVRTRKNMMDFYMKHCKRIGYADRRYLNQVNNKLSEMKDKKQKTYLSEYLRTEGEKVKNRINQREDETIDITDDNLDFSANKIAGRRFIRIFNYPCSTLTPIEAIYILGAYQQTCISIDLTKIPSKNRLYIKFYKDNKLPHIKLSEGKRMTSYTITKNKIRADRGGGKQI